MNYTKEQIVAERQRRNSLKDPSSSGYTREQIMAERERRNNLKPKEKSWAQTGKDLFDDARGLPSKFAQGAAALPDVLAYPFRKGLEYATGREIPTLGETIENIDKSSGAYKKPKTGTGRIAQHGAEFAGSMLGGAGAGKALSATGQAIKGSAPFAGKALEKISGWVGNPQTPKEMAHLGLLGGATGLVSGVAQELGAPPIIADIGSAIAVPAASHKILSKSSKNLSSALNPLEQQVAQNLETRIGEENVPGVLRDLESYQAPLEGYAPSTAEAAQNEGLYQLHRAHQGDMPELARHHEAGTKVVQNALEKPLASTGDLRDTQDFVSQAREKARDIINQYKEKQLSVSTPEEAGTAIREGVETTLKAHKKLRKHVSEPLYKAVRKNKTEVETPTTKGLIKNYLEEEGVKDAIKGDLQDIQKSLTSNKSQKGRSKAIDEFDKQYAGMPENIRNETKKALGLTEILPKAKEVDHVVKLVDKKIQRASRTQDFERAYVLKEIKNAILKDLEVVPEVAQARGTYRAYSKPISNITEDKALGKVVEKDIFKRDYLTSPAELPKLFTTGLASIQNARNLKTTLGWDKKALTALKDYTYKDFLEKTLDPNGSFSLSKIQSWKNTNKGAPIIDKDLHKTIDNISKASKELKDNKLYKDVLGEGSENIATKHIVDNLLSGQDSLNKVKQLTAALKEGGNEKAFDGIRKGATEHLLKNITNGSENANGLRNFSYPKFKQYFNKNHDALSEIYTKDQMKTLENVMEVLKAKNIVANTARASGSDTKANLTIAEAMSSNLGIGVLKKILSKLPGVSWGAELLKDAGKAMKDSRETRTKDILQRALTEPDYAKVLLTKLKDLKRNDISKLSAKPVLISSALKDKLVNYDNNK
jgi:hypothetical protein